MKETSNDLNRQKSYDFKFSQVFGDKMSMEKVDSQDVISSIEFDKSGKQILICVSLGDKAGRLIMFEENELSKGRGSKYQYMSELQSHVKEFDYLKSTDIDEKIVSTQFLRQQGNHIQILTTNDKTIKLWRLTEKEIKKPQEIEIGNEFGVEDIKIPKMENFEKGWFPSLIKIFPNLHNYLINSINLASNEEYVISTDDLKIYLWNLQKPHDAYNVVDIKPDNLDDIQEVITCSKYHPFSDNLFLYGTSKGSIKLQDLRKSCQTNKNTIEFKDDNENQQKNFFSEIVASIGDACFSANGRYIFCRDFLSVKVWDINMPNKPLSVTNIYDPLKSKLCELYENEQILEKFDIKSSPDSNLILTGNFNSTFHLINRESQANDQYELNFRQKTIVNHISQKNFEKLGPSYNFNKKVNKIAFHPTKNIVSLACLNTLFFYQTSS